MTPDPAYLLPSEAMDAPLPDAALDAYTQDEPDENSDAYQTASRWIVDDDQKAEWAMRKLAEAVVQVDSVQEQADRYKAEIDQWVERVTKAPMRTAVFMEHNLRDYAETQVADGRSSIDLPSGKITTRDMRRTPRLVIENVIDAAAWACSTLDESGQDDVVPHQPPKVLVSKLKDHVAVVDGVAIDANGEPVPGVRVEYGVLSVSIRPR